MDLLLNAEFLRDLSIEDVRFVLSSRHNAWRLHPKKIQQVKAYLEKQIAKDDVRHEDIMSCLKLYTSLPGLKTKDLVAAACTTRDTLLRKQKNLPEGVGRAALPVIEPINASMLDGFERVIDPQEALPFVLSDAVTHTSLAAKLQTMLPGFVSVLDAKLIPKVALFLLSAPPKSSQPKSDEAIEHVEEFPWAVQDEEDSPEEEASDDHTALEMTASKPKGRKLGVQSAAMSLLVTCRSDESREMLKKQWHRAKHPDSKAKLCHLALGLLLEERDVDLAWEILTKAMDLDPVSSCFSQS